MATVRFTSDQDLGPGKVYKSGQEVDLDDASAFRWIRRGVAERIHQPTVTRAPHKAAAVTTPSKRGRKSANG